MSSSNPIKRKIDEENMELVSGEAPPTPHNLSQSLLLKCINSNTYCLSLMDYIKKVYHFSQIDFYSAYIQLMYCFKPHELNEIARIRKHLKNQWARDDPGFVIVIMLNILVTSFSYCLAYNRLDRLLNMFVIQFLFFFIFLGIIIAFGMR